MADPSSCSICCLDFTKKVRLPIPCGYCKFAACTTCVRTYLLQDSTPDPCCMKCRTIWPTEFIDQHLSLAFRKGDYAKHRKDVLVEREKARLPDTMPAVEHMRELNHLKKQREALQSQIKKAQTELTEAWNNRAGILAREHRRMVRLQEAMDDHAYLEATPYEEMQLRVTTLARTIRQYLNTKYELNGRIGDAKYRLDRYMYPERSTRTRAPTRTQFVRACPADGCRGFLSAQWTCGLCDAHVCKKCHDILPPVPVAQGNHQGANAEDEEARAEAKEQARRSQIEAHTCDPNKVATAQLLAKDTKPCPKCAAMIFKVDGCDQMWCTQCHTAFSWRTGIIEEGHVHNPEYYRWMREHRGEPPRERHPDARGGNAEGAGREEDQQGNAANACMAQMRQFQQIPMLGEVGAAIRRFDLAIAQQAAEASDLIDAADAANGEYGPLRLKYPDTFRSEQVYQFHRYIQHIKHVVLTDLEQFFQRREPNIDLRIKYLMQEIQEHTWKSTLIKRERAREEARVAMQVFELVVQVGGEFLHRICQARYDMPALMQALLELSQFADYYIQNCKERLPKKFSAREYLLDLEDAVRPVAGAPIQPRNYDQLQRFRARRHGRYHTDEEDD